MDRAKSLYPYLSEVKNENMKFLAKSTSLLAFFLSVILVVNDVVFIIHYPQSQVYENSDLKINIIVYLLIFLRIFIIPRLPKRNFKKKNEVNLETENTQKTKSISKNNTIICFLGIISLVCLSAGLVCDGIFEYYKSQYISITDMLNNSDFTKKLLLTKYGSIFYSLSAAVSSLILFLVPPEFLQKRDKEPK